MNIIKYSCGGEGCTITDYDLAHDVNIKPIYSGVDGRRDVTKKLLFIPRKNISKQQKKTA